MAVEDTGFGGGSLFDWGWQTANLDALGKNFTPLRYGRVEIDLGGAGIAEGVIIKVGEPIEEADETTYWLRISTQADLSNVDMNQLAVRVLA